MTRTLVVSTAAQGFSPRAPPLTPMPNITFDITPATDRTVSFDGKLIDPGQTFPGYVFSFMAFVKDGSAESGQVYIQAGTFRDSVAEDHLLATLLNGYVYTGYYPTWSGRHPIEQGEGIWCAARSDGVTVTVRFIGKVMKQDP